MSYHTVACFHTNNRIFINWTQPSTIRIWIMNICNLSWSWSRSDHSGWPIKIIRSGRCVHKFWFTRISRRFILVNSFDHIWFKLFNWSWFLNFQVFIWIFILIDCKIKVRYEFEKGKKRRQNLAFQKNEKCFWINLN